ncbi:MAG: hypothetical protein H0Z24_05670 [Thermosipho sp. (in: Bacteria)]|nr:hypothetical protein [Thermosipho sp. (in: thermotogales)]
MYSELILNEEELKKELEYWKNKLNMNDWYIKVKKVRLNELELPDVQGEVSYEVVSKTAVIRILDEKDYPNLILPQNHRITLIHELLHCKFAHIENALGEIGYSVLHGIIEDLAKAFNSCEEEKC